MTMTTKMVMTSDEMFVLLAAAAAVNTVLWDSDAAVVYVQV